MPMSSIKIQERYVIYGSMFVMGGCGLAYEYTLSKIASDLLGNSARQWAVIIGVMMFFMGIGSDIQKYLKSNNLFDKFIFFEILLGVLGGIGPICILFAYGKFQSHFILVQYSFISLIGLLIGLEIPLLTRINESYTDELKFNIGGILKMDYIGALCGALFWVFVLPKFFTVIEMAAVLGLLTILTAAFALFYFRKLVANYTALLGICLCSVLLMTLTFVHAQELTSHAEQYLYRDRVVLSKTSEFQHIVLTQSARGTISCFINGNLQFNSNDEYIYHENLVHPAMSISPRRNNILVLGGGDGLAVREILKYDDIETVTVVDIDAEMTRLATENPHFRKVNNDCFKSAKVKIITEGLLNKTGELENIIMSKKQGPHQTISAEIATVSIINIDAVKFVEQVSGIYDVIIIDFPDPNTLDLAKLYSDMFYHLLLDNLNADGIIVQQSTSPIHAKEAFLCIGRTMTESGLIVVPYHDNVPSFGEWGWWIGTRSFVNSEHELKEKLKSVDKLNVSTRYLTPEIIKASLVFGKGQLITNYIDITTITNSKVHDYYIDSWQNLY